MGTVLASAANARYGDYLLNMVGSVKAESDIFPRIVVYDLGLDRRQRRLAASIRGVELRALPRFVPHWAEGFTWKPWIWTHVDAATLVWLDAGLTVLRPLDDLLGSIADRGYFAVSQGHPVADIVPRDYYELYNVSTAIGARTTIAAGIVGFDRTSSFYRDVVVPTYEDCVAGRSVGFSRDELGRQNHGLQRTETPILRDCRRFRWDQTVLNLRFYAALDDPVVHELDKYAGYRSSRDHPEQVIWSHRRRGDFRYLTRVPYRWPVAPFGLAWGAWARVRRWRQLHAWLFRPSTYVGKAKRLRRSL